MPPVCSVPDLVSDARVLVTGASGGIGAAVVRIFRASGAEVIATDLMLSDGAPACDITDERQVDALFQVAGSLDHVVHAAGVVTTGAVRSLVPAEFRRVVDINLVGSFLVAQRAAGAIRSGGTLTLLSSQGGRKGGASWSAYCASKFGVIGLMESLAQELAPEAIRVNAVCPGSVDTEATRSMLRELAAERGITPEEQLGEYVRHIPMGRMITAEEVAGACLLLASPLAGCITGTSLVVDGGELS